MTRITRDMLSRAFPDQPRMVRAFEEIDKALDEAGVEVAGLQSAIAEAVATAGDIPGQLAKKQPLHAILTALASIDGTAGVVEMAGPAQFAIRRVGSVTDGASLVTREQLLGSATAGAGYVAASRSIATTAPLAGGGDLSADRTLSIAAATGAAAGSMSAADKTKLDAISGTNTGDQFTNMISSRILGRVTAGFGAAEQLTGTQTTTLIDVFTPTLKGAVPASGGGTTNFLRADGVFAAPPAGGGGSGYSISTKTAAYTETATNGEVIALLDLAAGFTVTLPTAVGNTAKLVFKKMQAAGSMVIDGAGAETIDGGATATLTNQYESITLVSDGSFWSII